MEPRTIDEIKDDIIEDLRTHPYLQDFSELSVLSTLVNMIAIQIYKAEVLIQTQTNAMSVLTATGSDLDRLVVDRLPEGRQSGDNAVGAVTFKRTDAALVAYTIPIGTRVIAVSEAGEQTQIETTALGTLGIGETQVVVAAQAVYAGTSGNIGAYTVQIMPTAIYGIESVENTTAFSGGTETETDDELRERYIYSLPTQGAATAPLLKEHIEGLDGIVEAVINVEQPGDVSIVVDDTSGISDDNDDVVDCIEENIAAGVVARGILCATIVDGSATTGVATSGGGRIWARALDYVSAGETIDIGYTTYDGSPRTGSVTVPMGTLPGVAIQGTLQAVADRVATIDSITYTGTNSYDLLVGMGTYPYLYNIPRSVPVSVEVDIALTDDPEPNLASNIAASLVAALNSYPIGRDLEFADIARYVYIDFTTGEAFVGIDDISSITITDDITTITTYGGSITIGNDQRVDPYEVIVNAS